MKGIQHDLHIQDNITKIYSQVAIIATNRPNIRHLWDFYLVKSLSQNLHSTI